MPIVPHLLLQQRDILWRAAFINACDKALSVIVLTTTLRKGGVYMGILDELLGGGQRQKVQGFVDRYEQGDPSRATPIKRFLSGMVSVARRAARPVRSSGARGAWQAVAGRAGCFRQDVAGASCGRGVTCRGRWHPTRRTWAKCSPIYMKPGRLGRSSAVATPNQQAQGSNPIIDMLSSPQAKAVLAGIAAMVVRRVMQGSSRTA